MTTNGTAQGAGLRDAARQLGVSVKTIRRHLERLGLPKTYADGPAGRWARIVLEPDTVDAIAAALGVQDVPGDTPDLERRTTPRTSLDSPADSPTETAQGHAGPWTARGQDAGQPRTALIPLDIFEPLADAIREAVAQGVLDGLARAAQDARERDRGGFASSRWGRALVGAAYAVAIAGTVLVGVLTVGLAHKVGALPW